MENQSNHERLRKVESELMAKHPNWPQSKANYFAMKLLCIIN